MTYKDSVTKSMTWLSKQKETVFLGYNICKGGRIYGTLNDVPLKKCSEMPVAENLILGCGIGLAIQGKFRPILVFERMDFLANAVDAIVNHLALLPTLSGGQFGLRVIIRTIIGSDNPKFQLGQQHNKDLQCLFDSSISVLTFGGLHSYQIAYHSKGPVMVVERVDDYDKILP